MTNAELAVLSLVAEQPRHGYEIEQVIEQRGMREWTEVGFSSIYYLLKKLEREELIEGRLEETGRGPARKVYHITAAGEEALHAGVLQALSVPQHGYPPLQLGLACWPVLRPSEGVAALRQYRAALSERLSLLQSKRHDQSPLPDFVDAMFEHSVALLQAELVWADQFISGMEERDEQA